jgi:polysaccharide biosynthesis protein PslH
VKRAVYLVADWPWPPTSGGRSHAANLSNALGRLFDVTVLSPDMPEPSVAWRAASLEMARRRGSPVTRTSDVVSSLLRGEHTLLRRATRAGLPPAFAEQLARHQPDLVVLGRPFFGPFNDVSREAGASVVADADESLERVARSLIRGPARLGVRLRALLELIAMRRLERREYTRVDGVWATNEIDVRWLARRGIPGVTLVRNAVVVNGPRPSTPDQVRAVAFVGWYGYAPNETAALELGRSIMPRVRALGGPRTLQLIGRDPTSAMRRLAGDDPDLVITGEVEDVRNAMRHAGVLAVPVRTGGGTRIKVLDAMAAGVPVVSTSRGVEGLGLQDGREVIIADTANAMASAIVRLAREPGLREELAARAFEALSATWTVECLWKQVAAAVRLAGIEPASVSSPRRRDR